MAEALTRERTRRRSLPGADLFEDPAWDILLHLFVHRSRGRVATVAATCGASGVPDTTALRHLALLETRGLIRWMVDPEDRRRSFVTLSDGMADAMASHLTEVKMV